MFAVQFELLLNLVAHQIVKQDTVPVHDRSMVTLRFLASGDAAVPFPPTTLYNWKNSSRSMSSHLWYFKGRIFKATFLCEELKEYADQFALKWQFPHCCGAINGKLIIIMVAPANCGSLYYNYKHAAIGVADANYKLIYVDTGCNGTISDRDVFTNC